MGPNIISSPTAAAPSASSGGENLLMPIMDFVSGAGSTGGGTFIEKALGILNGIWLAYVVFAYILCIFMLVIYVYASTGKKRLEDLDDEARTRREQIYEEHFKSGPKNNRIQDMFEHVSSDSPNDWKLAIIEADIILDEILKEKGYAGVSLGERLKSVSPTQLQSLDDAWQAHKVRNQIAHGGADFILTHKLAQDTIKQYRRVFHEFGVN
jgi:uncharacterized membrane protein